MQRDMRNTALFEEIQSLCVAVRRPGTDQISEAAEAHASPSGDAVVFAGTLVQALQGIPTTRICCTDLDTGHTSVLTVDAGPHGDRSPQYSPDGAQLAFLSDRLQQGNFQLYLSDLQTGAVRAGPAVAGWVEYLRWSPEGGRILLGVAGHGADVGSAQGAITSRQQDVAVPAWMPAVEEGAQDHQWRRAWIYDLSSNTVRLLDWPGRNLWEAVWSGRDAIAAIVSEGPSEGDWYHASLARFDLSTHTECELWTPTDQLGCLAATGDGRYLSVVEAICSDRGVVAGTVRLFEVTSGRSRTLDALEVDIGCCEWRADGTLLLAGHQGLETVIGLYDPVGAPFTELWRSEKIATAGRFATVCALRRPDECVLIGEGFTRAPEIAVIRAGHYRTVKSFDLGYGEVATAIESVETLSWQAPDGLEIQGWLLKPTGSGPYPLVMQVHGGPVSHWKPTWLGRGGLATLMLLRRGYAVFLPNPRGSTGRGQSFVRQVMGDFGGADATDCLSGLDELVRRGLADPARLGVTGGSYGGFMTCWLVTQTCRFAAAVPVAPVTNWTTEHLLSNIPHFVTLGLDDSYDNPHGAYFGRSPVMHARKARTPTLNVCGALDRCTPAQEAMQFHNALLENGVESVLVTYPEEGHGIRKWPASVDFAARVVDWFERYMPA